MVSVRAIVVEYVDILLNIIVLTCFVLSVMCMVVHASYELVISILRTISVIMVIFAIVAP